MEKLSHMRITETQSTTKVSEQVKNEKAGQKKVEVDIYDSEDSAIDDSDSDQSDSQRMDNSA